MGGPEAGLYMEVGLEEEEEAVTKWAMVEERVETWAERRRGWKEAKTKRGVANRMEEG